MVDIKINATPSFTKPGIILLCIQYPKKKLKILPISVSCEDVHFNLWPVFVSGVDGVISIELNID